MIFPGKFIPQRASKLEDSVTMWAPPQLFGLIVLLPLCPGALLEYAIFSGHVLIGWLGLLVWIPLLWLFLIEIHDMGRVRFWLSAPITLLAHLIVALYLARSF